MNVFLRLLPALVAALMLAAAAVRAAEKDPNDERLARAAALRGSDAPDDQAAAQALCRTVIADPKASRNQQFAAFRTLVDVLWYRRRDAAAAVAALADLRTRFPGDLEADRTATYRAADVLWESGRDLEQAVALLNDFASRAAADAATVAQARVRLVRFLIRLQRLDEAYATASRAAELVPEDPELVAAALWEMQSAADAAQDHERRLQALRRAIEPRYTAHLDSGARHARLTAYAQVLLTTGRLDDLRAFAEPLEQSDAEPGQRQAWCLLLAEALLKQDRLDEALPAFERVVSGHPSVHHHWWNAQTRIVEILRRQNRLDDAVRATRILLDAAWDHNTLTQAGELAVSLLVAIDDLPDRANAFIAWQTYGPTGKDGIAGTADDPLDPVAAYPYPDLSSRAAAFNRASADLGDAAAGARQRAWMALYTGTPGEALSQRVDAMARSGIDDLDWIATELVQQTLRAVVGHGGRTGEFCMFIAWGPAGPDQIAGNADDLPDPFAGLVPPAPPGPGGLAHLTPAEVSDLQQLGAALQTLLVNSSEPRWRRTACARGLQRVQQALASWQPEALRELALETAVTSDDRELARACLSLGALCAKGRDLHLGGIHAFLRQLDAMCQARGAMLGEGVREALSRSLERHTTNLTRQKPLVPRLRPIPVILGDNPPLEPRLPAALLPGLNVASYELDPKQRPRALPDFAALTPSHEATTGTVTAAGAARPDHIALRFAGYIRVPRSTGYRFHLRSKDGSRLLIGETEVVNHDGPHGASERSGVINLKAGYHPLTVLYFCGQGNAEVRLSWESYGIPKQEVPAEAYVHEGP